MKTERDLIEVFKWVEGFKRGDLDKVLIVETDVNMHQWVQGD